MRISDSKDASSRATFCEAGTTASDLAGYGDLKQHIKRTFEDLLSISASALVQGGDDPQREAKLWDCFAEVYDREVSQRRRGGGPPVTLDDKRQILADILVWAEVTQEHYDKGTAAFVTERHLGDGHFQRIGRALQEAKERRGLA